MTRDEIIAAVAQQVTDEDVYSLAERADCSYMDARATLEAEAFSLFTGQPINYEVDWRNLI